MERTAADRRSEQAENHKMLSLLDQLYPESKNRSKKNISGRFLKDMPESKSDFVYSAGVGRLVLELDRLARSRGCRRGRSQNQSNSQNCCKGHLTKSKW